MIKYSCPACRVKLQSRPELVGQTIACGQCGSPVQVPQAKATTAVIPLGFREPADAAAILDLLPADTRARADRLGEPQSLYKPNSVYLAVQLFLGLALCAGSAALLLLYRPTDPLFIALALVPSLAGCAAFYYWWRNPRQQVVVFSQGILLIQGTDPKIIPWKKIDQVWQSVTDIHFGQAFVVTWCNFRLQLQDGQPIVFNNALDRVQLLGVTIQQEVSRIQVPTFINEFNEGMRLDFGPLTVELKGLSYYGSLLPWQAVNSVKAERGRIVVRGHAGWRAFASVPASKIPNLMTFLALVQLILEGNRPEK